MTTQPTLTVRGVTVPRLGFGTWEVAGEDTTTAVRHALEIGYRHVDTARAYENEEQVGRALAESEVDRSDVFLTTKVPPYELDDIRGAAEDSLRSLGVDYLDLLLQHWPSRDHELERVMADLEDVREAGIARLIGVSNFPAGMLRRACELAPVATDQVEFHPFLEQDRLLAMVGDDLFVTSYSPLGRGLVADDPTLREIGEAHGKSAGQVALRWLLDFDGVAVLSRSVSPARRQENFEVFDFELTADERRRIAALPKDLRQINPDIAPDWDA